MLRFIFLVQQYMEEIEYESFNLQKEVDNKLKRIKIYQELENIKNTLLKLSTKREKLGVTSDKLYLKNLNDNNHRKIELDKLISDNNYRIIKINELENYINNKNIILNLKNIKYGNYDFNNNTKSNIDRLSFNNCTLLDFHLDGNYFIQNYNFINTIFNNGSNTELGGFFGINKNIIEAVSIIYYNIKNTNNGTLTFSNFKINNILIQEKEFNTRFEKIDIETNIKLDTLLLDNIVIGELILENINNNFESFEVRNCKIDKLIIKNSNLGKAVFNGVTIKKLEIQNATLNDCIFNGVDFENYELLNESNVSAKIMKDNYRQLKHVMDKNANYTEANKFFGLEIYYYYKSLKWYNLNKIILLIQGLISYFGNSWILAIIWIMIFGLLITGLSGNVYFYDSVSLLNHNNINFYNSFFTNINPFNKSLFISTNITGLLFSNKIVLIILYYQLIIALKRTTKR